MFPSFRVSMMLVGSAFCTLPDTYVVWNRALRLDHFEGLPCLRLIDNHGSSESHLVVFDTGSGHSFLNNVSRPEPEITLLANNSGYCMTPLLGPHGNPVVFTLESGSIGERPTLGARKLTSFSNTFGTFMLFPSAPNALTLVFDPITYDYCADGNPIYVTTSQYDRLIQTRLQVLDANQGGRYSHLNATDFFEVASGSNFDIIPEPAFEAVVESIVSSGGIILSNETYHFTNCVSLSDLPPLAFSFSNHDGPFEARIEFHMFPEDYVERLGGGICALRLRPSTESRILGLNLLRNIAVHFDDLNNEVGFCDPM